MFYLPILYYPTKKDDRATGFLIPTYGVVDAARPVASQRVLLGDRPQPGRDVPARLVLEDRPGRRQRVPLQRRRRLGRQHPRLPRSTSTRRPTSQSDGGDDAVHAGVAQLRDPRRRQPGAARSTSARARSVDYFSSIATTQTFNTNIYDASRNHALLRRQRGRRLGHVLAERHVRPQRVLLRPPPTRSLSGSWPRVVAHAQRAAVARTRRVYFSVGTEFAAARCARRIDDGDRRPTTSGLSRFDFAPQIRYPFKKWQWFTVNSTRQLARHVLHAQLRPDRRPTVRRRWSTSA